ncbi:MAG: acetylglutamate kinase [Phototrophicaceae bacterium]|jgi:acetylglutamate kinase
MTEPILLKVGGHELNDPEFLNELPIVIRELAAPVIVVHGGGVEISDLQKRLGITPRYTDGVRITDIASLQLVEMVLCGTVNKRLVAQFIEGGLEALGMSGIDQGIIRAEQMPHDTEDMQFTGQVTRVRGDILKGYLAQGITPVIAPVCLGDHATRYNVNADHVAGSVAVGVGAAKVVFLTNVEGVLEQGVVRRTLSPDEAERMIRDEIIFGGMIPKVQTALEALERGVPQAVITNLKGLRTHGGTVFSR